LDGDSPRAALDVFIRRFRSTLACVAEAHVVGDGYDLGRAHILTARASGGDGYLPLRARASGRADLSLYVTHGYRIAGTQDEGEHGSYRIQSLRYRYEIYDLEGTELLLYHWHPDGLSSVTAPRHRATPGRRRQTAPANQVLLEDIIELLIRGLGVEPGPEHRAPGSPRYWETVLRDNRAAV
jgi:hypothetical protein